MVERELARENLAAAEALLAELPAGASAAQTEAVERLAARLRRRQGEVAALRELARDHDLRTGSRARSYAALIFAAASLSNLALYFMERAEQVTFADARLFVLHGVGPLAVIGLILAVLWRPLTQNRANRQIIAMLVVVGTVIVAFRLLAVATDLRREVAFACEYLFWGMAFMTAAIFGERRLVPGGLLLLAGGVAGALAPTQVLLCAFLSAFVSMLWMTYVWWPRQGVATPAGRQESGVFRGS
jgi:hypothetical protein